MEQRNRNAGVYGSTCDSNMDDLWGINHPPHDAWFAQWNSNPSVYDINTACVPDNHFPGGLRLHQYYNGNTTYGSIQMLIDKNCSYGEVTPAISNVSQDPNCTS